MATELKDQLQAALGSSYVLERELGRGGMATVFLAQDAKHGRPVALKVLHQDLAASLGPERFRREIALAARLQHPHILSVHDSGETPTGELWFTMPFVEGESLRDRLRREGQLPLEDALRITREVALALEYAHRHGVIHRDVKPENILLTSDGQALVADFGIARALAPGTSTTTLTETGAAIGTPQYMSPEQASAERTLTSRTDVYSLGAVLYEMLAGEPPFTGPTAQAIVAKMMTGEPPSVRRARASVPAAVDAAIQKAIALVPADRFATALEFSKALDAAERTGLTAAPSVALPSLPSTSPPLPSRRRFPLGTATLALGIAIGAGLLFAWRHHAGGSVDGGSGPVRLAVLPFDNLGDSADAYFADGMTDAVREKLTALPGLEVVAPASSGQYRHTTKSVADIGRELGARYLVVGKVRWAKGAGSASRVDVQPALVDASTSADKWEQSFDAPLTDVFQVQADIAGKVAQQLKVALTPASQHTLAQRPTQNLDAYDAYLRGKDIARRGDAPAIRRQAAAAYRDAVERDSTFALAWAALADAYSGIYFEGVPTPGLGDSAHIAAVRAMALAPELPEADAALAEYDFRVPHDLSQALTEYSAALSHAPNNVALLKGAATVERTLGRWDAADTHLRQAARLDPRDADVADLLCRLEVWRHDYAGAESEIDRAYALQPDNVSLLHDRVLVALTQGDLPGARRIVRAGLAAIDTTILVAYLATYYDLGWVLDSAQERVLLGLGPAVFDNDRANWSMVLSEQYWYRGDVSRSRAYADTARLAFAEELATTPNIAQQHLFYGLALAYLGKKDEAVREVERGLALAPYSSDAFNGPYFQLLAVRIYLAVGDTGKALDLFEPLLRIPFYLTPAWLRIDPNFAPLHGNPRFERLIAAGS